MCGSQSSGKSSVLEAITEIPFPRSENTCTRFVTKVTLRPHPRELVEVKIEQADPASSRKSVPRFPPITDLRNLSSELQEQFTKAADAILGNQPQTKFSRDILSITISGPDRPILQILDLPGLITHDASDKKNPILVEEIVESEMKKQHSTILAVVAANRDFKTQGVLSLCEEYDSKGERTVGIITRPDKAENSQAETCVAIAQGLRKDEVRIQHGWHVLRNRNSEELKNNTTIEARNAAEERFLREEPWARLGPENLGVVTLRIRLSKILLDATSREFPKLMAKTKAQLKELAAERKSLGGDNRTEEEKRHIFSVAAENLKDRTSYYVKGIPQYDANHHHLDPSHPIHIGSRIVEQSELFRDRIMTEGHAYSSQLEPSGINPDADLRSIASHISAMEKLEPSSKTPQEEIQEAKKHLDELRGDELPGTFNPQHINDFFREQSKLWNQIAEEHIGKAFEHCKLYFKHATPLAFAPDPLRSERPTFVNHQVVAERVFKLICGKLEKMKEEAKRELSQIENDRTETQLNSLPKYLAEYRQQRNTRNANRTTDALVKDVVLQNKDLKRPIPELNPNTIAEGQRRHTQDDRTEEEAEDFLNAAWLQYKVCDTFPRLFSLVLINQQVMRDCYIVNIATQVVERHFMQGLSELTPEVHLLEDKMFQELVEEDKHLEQRKEELKRKSEVLQKCHDILEQHGWR